MFFRFWQFLKIERLALEDTVSAFVTKEKFFSNLAYFLLLINHQKMENRMMIQQTELYVWKAKE